MKPLIYLASPYSHKDPQIRQARYEGALAAVATLLGAGHFVYSPIVHNHPVAASHDLPTGWRFWEEFDSCLLRRCDSLVILCLEGWEHSHGVFDEIRLARGLGLPVEYMKDVADTQLSQSPVGRDPIHFVNYTSQLNTLCGAPVTSQGRFWRASQVTMEQLALDPKEAEFCPQCQHREHCRRLIMSPP